MANGGSLGGLCGEGQRLAVALLQYICAKIGQHWWGTPADRHLFSHPGAYAPRTPTMANGGSLGEAVWHTTEFTIFLKKKVHCFCNAGL